MRPRARAVLLACAALAAATLPAGPALAAGHATPGRAALTWTVTPSPNTNYRGNQLMDVSCGSASACTAVGFTSSRQGFTKTLVESWNGTTWTIAPSPNRAAYNPLTSVSCTSASACTAVGISYTSHGAPRALVESWDGTTWTIVPSPNPNAPNREADLEGVSCSGLSACMAVGFYSRKFGPPITLAESWNGTTWTVLPTPNPGPGPGKTREGDWLQNVSCLSATACTAVGYLEGSAGPDHSIIESWNGTAWSIVPHPGKPSGDNFLTGVSCASATLCTAVGGYHPNGSPSTAGSTLVEAWNGTAWSLVASPNVAGASGSRLDRVSCPSATMCVAVGGYLDTSTSPSKTLVESWDGTAWAIDPSPNPGGASTSAGLGGVSCPTTATCLAVGGYGTTQPGAPVKTLAELGTSAG